MAKNKFCVEYSLGHASPTRVWPYLCQVQGLEAWFADRVDQDGKKFSFHWGDTSQDAALLSMRRDVYVRYRWNTDEPHIFFELRISHGELTDETTLTVTDHAADDDEQDDLTDLWDQQVDKLRRNLGIN